jgi:N-acetylneuraminic acid mutarotase
MRVSKNSMDVHSIFGRGCRGKANSYRPLRAVAVVLLALGLVGLARAAPAEDLPGQWKTLAPSSASRQEVSYVEVGGKFYLAGGRNKTLHERYDPKTNSWSTVKPLPAQRDHIQGVELGGKIYYIGGLSAWPKPHVNTVYVYDPATNTFSQGTRMPEGRGRGAGGVAAYNGKIYYAGGMHDGKTVSWFDVYDPVAKTWKQLPNMPRARDHFHAAVVGGKFYAIGGRNSSISLNATIPKVDVYDLTKGAGGSWQTPNTELPTPRGGFATAVLGREILVIGGEGGGKAYNTVEAYETANNSWRKLEPMPTARHGIQAAVCNGGVYVAAGGTKQGGGGATNQHEVLFLGAPTTCGTTTASP